MTTMKSTPLRTGIQEFFPTRFYSSKIPSSLWKRLRPALLKEIAQLESMDDEGRKWSKANYQGSYTSYSSISDLPRRSSNFELLQDWIDREVAKFSKTLELDLQGTPLQMRTCWVNVMRKHTYHSSHLHPLSTISGTFYLQTPKGSGGFRIEDPRLPALMGSPPRSAKASLKNRSYITLEPDAGHLILFESWLKHEVLPHQGKQERISISFNYEW